MLFSRDCTENEHKNTCEKPISSSYLTLAIFLSVFAVVVGSVLLVLTWLHCKRRKRDRAEAAAAYDDEDVNDYVLDELEATRPKRMERIRRKLFKKHLDVPTKTPHHTGPSPIPSRERYTELEDDAQSTYSLAIAAQQKPRELL